MSNFKYIINSEYENRFKDFLLNIKSHFKDNKQTIHKARNELKIIPFSDIQTVVKSFKIPNKINQYIYGNFRDSKAKKSYNNSLKLGDFTPKPIGYIEFYEKDLLQESYFLSEKFEYDFTIRETLLNENFSNREQILREFAHFTYQLHENRIFHDDYSPGNILIKKHENGHLFKIVDVNRMEFKELSSIERAKNFSKLWAKDEDLTIIGDEYSKYYFSDRNFTHDVCHYSLQNKKIKNFKKRLKGQEIDW